MDRTVPRTGSEEIELYIRTYYSLLRSTAEVKIQTLQEVHGSMNASLHHDARAEHIDASALIYSSLRLPRCILQVSRVVLGQSLTVFIDAGYTDLEAWEPAVAKARRRRGFFDGEETLALFIASRSDIDDIIPMLTAFQIEWNKLHHLMRGQQVRSFLEEPMDDEEGLGVLAHGIGMEREDLSRLRQIWGEDFWTFLRTVAAERKRILVRLLASSLNEYRRVTQAWWEQAESSETAVKRRPVYFISSNPHSIVNLLSGFALRHEGRLTEFLERPENHELLEEWQEIESRNVPSSRENFLYYSLKKFCETPQGQAMKSERAQAELSAGILRIPPGEGLDIQTQIIDLSKLRPEWVDPRLVRADLDLLGSSEAMIVNIDYPLGMAAYLLLTQVASRVGSIQGIYIIGKAATLNGVVGDVLIPTVVHDEHSQNTYLFGNCFTAETVIDHLVYGTVLDNQKAVSVRGTFLQNPDYMDVFYREGYTVIEMEAGPYLSAIYELFRPQRHPTNEVVNLHGIPFDLGIMHYASDTPLSKGKNLGAGSLSYFGMDPTYATSLAAIRRIFDLEIRRVRQDEDRRVRIG